MVRSNLHTHTNFCDGAAPPIDYVEKALELGFTALGFSGHSLTVFDSEYCLDADCSEYRKEILRLKELYKDKIFISLGLERDSYSVEDNYNYEYVIGSSHYVKKGDDFIAVDRSDEYFANAIKSVYGGDAMCFVKDYYETQANVIKRTKGDIVGHFDLIKKFNYGNKYFDEDDKKYINYALEAVDAVCEDADIFEINSGAAARGANPIPYPSSFILKHLKEKGKQIILSSDSHKPESLAGGFEISLQMVKDAGFTSVIELCENGFKETKI